MFSVVSQVGGRGGGSATSQAAARHQLVAPLAVLKHGAAVAPATRPDPALSDSTELSDETGELSAMIAGTKLTLRHMRARAETIAMEAEDGGDRGSDYLLL